MPLAAMMGLKGLGAAGEDLWAGLPKVRPDNCVLMGMRDMDPAEKENMRRAGIGVFTMRDIDERGCGR